MPISQTDQVFKLVKSLTKAEKRNFRLYAKRIQNNEELLFLRLFDLIDKQKVLNEKEIISKLANIDKGKLSNVKRHLYKQIVTSLRMIHKEKRANFKVREYIDFAYILYGKGLYLQALKILNKAKVLAQKYHLIYMQLTIVELEKTIEARHITRTGYKKNYELVEECKFIQNNANNTVILSNLRLKTQSIYLESGHVQNEDDVAKVKSYYLQELDKIKNAELGGLELVYLAQAGLWYHYILMEFEKCLEHAKKWVEILNANPSLISRDVNMYMRGYHYILVSAYNIQNRKIHGLHLAELEAYRKSEYLKFNPNSQIISFLYVHIARLDNITLNGRFGEAEATIVRSLNRLKRYSFKIDDHRILLFYYKFAWVYLGNNQPEKAIIYTTKIINNELKSLRKNIQNYTRILHLICHYELENYNILDYLLQTSSNYFNRSKDVNHFLQLSMEMFKQLKVKGKMDHRNVFKDYLTEFRTINKDPYERRALVYLDMISWLESKIKGVSLEAIIKGQL